MAELLAEWVNQLQLLGQGGAKSAAEEDFDYKYDDDDAAFDSEDSDSDSDLEESGEEGRTGRGVDTDRGGRKQAIDRYAVDAESEAEPDQVLVDDRDLQHMFASGYMVGKLLNKFNQQPDFGKFMQSGSERAVINNWCRLLPTLDRLGVKVDAQMVAEMAKGCDLEVDLRMGGDGSGAGSRKQVLKLLYGLKMSLDKV